jgi:hypothetical protein
MSGSSLLTLAKREQHYFESGVPQNSAELSEKGSVRTSFRVFVVAVSTRPEGRRAQGKLPSGLSLIGSFIHRAADRWQNTHPFADT